MSFESPKTDKKIPSSFSSPEFAGPNAHEMSVMSNDSTMDSIATNVSSSMAESKIIKSVNSNTHDSGFGDYASTLEESSTTSKKLIARAEHLITVSNEPGQPDITLTTRIDNKEKSKLKSVEEDIDVKQADQEVITIVKTTKLTTKVEKVRRKKRKNSKKLEESQESLSKSPSQESNVESVDDSNQNQSESLVYQVDINKSTEELVYRTMNKKSDEIETSETKPSTEAVLDLNSTVLDCEEILSNYSASNANNPGSPRHNLFDKEAEQLVPSVPSEPIGTNGALGPAQQQQLTETESKKKKGFFKRFRSRDKEANVKRKLDPKSDTPVSPSKQFKPAKHYNLEKYVLISTDEKERILYMKKECVDLIVEKLSDLIEQQNDQILNEMVSRSLDLLRHDRIESFDKLAQELDREYNIANVAVFDENQMQSVFNKQMKKLIMDEKALLSFELDKSRKPCEEFIEFESGEIGANLNSIKSENLISQIKQTEDLEQANQNEMAEQAKEKCPTPPSTPQNELGSGDGAAQIKDSPVVSPAQLSKEILTKVNESSVNDTSVQAPRQIDVNKKPKRKSTLSSCFTCAGVLKLSDDESRPQQQKEKKSVVVSKPNEQEVVAENTSAANVLVQTTLMTHDLDKKPVESEAVGEEKNEHEEKFIPLDTDDTISQINNDEEKSQENFDQEKQEVNQVRDENVQVTNSNEKEDKQADEIEQAENNLVVEEVKNQENTIEMPAKKSKNKKKKKKKKNKIEKSECVDKNLELENKNQETKEVSTQEDEETEIKIEKSECVDENMELEIKNQETKETLIEQEQETEIKIKKNESVVVVDDDVNQNEKVNEQEENIEIEPDQMEERVSEIKQNDKDENQLEQNGQFDANKHVIETLKVITERVVQESQPVEIQIDESKCDPKEYQVEIKQEIDIGKELPVEIDTDLYKPAAVQQNDPVVLPNPREKTISLAVQSESQAEAKTEPVAVEVNEAESEEDTYKVSCFSCKGKKAAKKAKGPKQPIVKSQPIQPESVDAVANLTPQIKSVNLDLFRGLDKPSSLSEMEKAIDYSDLSVVPTVTIRENQVEDVEEVAQQVPKTVEIELPSDLTSAIDLPPTSPSKEQIVQAKSEMEQILEPAPVPETQIPTIRIEETFDNASSLPIDLSTPPKKPPRGHLDTSLIDETEILTDQNVKMNVKEALVQVNSPEESSKLDETKSKKDKRSKTSIIDLPLIDILVPKESKKSKSDNKIGKELLDIEPKGTSIELNQPEVELFIEKCDSSKNKIQTIDLSNDDKKLLKAKRNEICEYLKQRSGYKLEQLIERTSQTTSKKDLKAKEKLADKLYQRSIKLMTKTRVKPMSFTELSKKLEKIVSPKTNAADIQKCVDQIKHELQNETLFSCLREKKSEQIVEKTKEQNVELVIENEVRKEEEPQAELGQEMRKDSINSEILLPRANLSWREANERARILFYKGQIPSIHYNEKRDSFHVSRLVNSSGKEKMSEVPVTDDDVKKLLNSCGLYWNGESIGLLDKSDEIFNSAQQEAFDFLNSIQVSESIQISENHCETVEQSKINYIY